MTRRVTSETLRRWQRALYEAPTVEEVLEHTPEVPKKRAKLVVYRQRARKKTSAESVFRKGALRRQHTSLPAPMRAAPVLPSTTLTHLSDFCSLPCDLVFDESPEVSLMSAAVTPPCLPRGDPEDPPLFMAAEVMEGGMLSTEGEW